MSPRKVRGVPLSNFPLIADHWLVIGEKKIDWTVLEKTTGLFKTSYISLQPLRRMFGLLVLEKVLNSEGDEFYQRWLETPMMQNFTGEELFHWDLPFTKEEVQMFKSQLSDKGQELAREMVEIVKKI